nr:MAG TPA: hypothetical protein [Caudoviricetes sp.]
MFICALCLHYSALCLRCQLFFVPFANFSD